MYELLQIGLCQKRFSSNENKVKAYMQLAFASWFVGDNTGMNNEQFIEYEVNSTIIFSVGLEATTEALEIEPENELLHKNIEFYQDTTGNALRHEPPYQVLVIGQFNISDACVLSIAWSS